MIFPVLYLRATQATVALGSSTPDPCWLKSLVLSHFKAQEMES